MSPPRSIARFAGFFYLLVFLTGFPLLSVRKLVVTGDAGATAANILAHQPIFWSGFIAQTLQVICYIAVTALFYRLFKPVSQTLSLAAAFFSLVGCAIQVSASVFYLASLAVLGAPYPSLFPANELRGLMLTFLKLNSVGLTVALIFFGCYCFLIGCLILRSTFLPKIPGVLMIIAGLGWLTFLVPPFAQSLQPWILLPGLIGEGTLTLWLLIVGVNEARWNAQSTTLRRNY